MSKPVEYIATHEAAHALVGLLLGSPPDYASIESDSTEGSLGHAISDHGDPFSDLGGEDWNLMVRAISSYAGHMATLRLGFDEDFKEAGAENDYRNAAFALDSIAPSGSDAYSALQHQAKETARMMVNICWPQIELLASELVEKRTLGASDIHGVLSVIPEWQKTI